MALSPPELVQTHLHLDQKVMGALRKEKCPVVDRSAGLSLFIPGKNFLMSFA